MYLIDLYSVTLHALWQESNCFKNAVMCGTLNPIGRLVWNATAKRLSISGVKQLIKRIEDIFPQRIFASGSEIVHAIQPPEAFRKPLRHHRWLNSLRWALAFSRTFFQRVLLIATFVPLFLKSVLME
ncbi:hypothetical protein TNCV_4629401 [Trichonephila clavipes]|nr:hypothetical protein TNCV_4629401 [Trichonephila clavipes]